MAAMASLVLLLALTTSRTHTEAAAAAAPPPPPPSPSARCHLWPFTCPGSKNALPRAPYKQTWQMNLSTIIQPCNNTGYTDPESTKGWGIVDCE